MATEIIASGNTAATSADRTVTSGSVESIIFRSTDVNAAQCLIEVKASDSAYYSIGSLGDAAKVLQIDGPLVYRVRRVAGVGSSAVDVEA